MIVSAREPRYKTLGEVLRNVVESDKYRAVFEYRPPKYMFGIKNYGEIRNVGKKQYMINQADNDPWDVFAPGYHYKLQLRKRYKIKDIIGLLFLENGNHKLGVRVYAPYFDKDLACQDIKTYIEEYVHLTGKRGWWIAIHDEYDLDE
tara:strand:+ start:91 stop:531 length:441 start_codon:yes stop_codon:yes gene_type:complete